MNPSPAQTPQLTLVSHVLCPYVQRAVIALTEKEVSFERVDIDLANKPDWFLRVSPMAKTPVLLVDGAPLFESAAICEYLDDTCKPTLHPEDPILRAQHRGWMEFGSAVLATIAGLYNAPDEAALQAKAQDLKQRFVQIEAALGAGPYFMGERFCMVDAVFGPVFRYFDVWGTVADFGIFADTPKVRAWRAALAERPSVVSAVQADYPELLHNFLAKREGALARRIASAAPI